MSSVHKISMPSILPIKIIIGFSIILWKGKNFKTFCNHSGKNALGKRLPDKNVKVIFLINISPNKAFVKIANSPNKNPNPSVITNDNNALIKKQMILSIDGNSTPKTKYKINEATINKGTIINIMFDKK